MFQSFVDSIPDWTVIAVRISDNVLEPTEWTVDLILLQNGVVTEQIRSLDGVYTIPDMVGWTASQVSEWSKYDGVGTYPEQYHEVFIKR